MSKAEKGTSVAVLGASPNEERFSFKAVRLLKENGFNPIPVHPKGHSVDGVVGLKSLTEIDKPVDTLTMYVNAKISDGEYDNIINLNPRRVIFNPGAENSNLAEKLNKSGIEIVVACTLIMLNTEEY
jgi:hypothetical protein